MEFRDLKAQYKKYKNEIDEGISKVLNHGRYINGPEVSELESILADYVGVKHCISCANGTDAMLLVLTAWDIKEGDAVFLPDFTFFATAEVVSHRGATPIFVDVERESFNVDTNKLEEAIAKLNEEGLLTPRVIIPVDLYGLPANYSEIIRIAEEYNLKILEDGAQGFGGEYNGKKACSFGDAATTSFFPAKPLGCYGDGGAIFTNDDKLASLLGSYKVHGQGTHKYDNVRVGFNSRLDSIQAAVLIEKFKALVNHELEDVNRVAKIYNRELEGVVKTPKIPDGYYSSYAQYTITLKNEEERDSLKQFLSDKDVPTAIYYVNPMHKQSVYEEHFQNSENFENSEFLCKTVLSLPIHPYLTEEEVLMVTNSIKEFYQDRVK